MALTTVIATWIALGVIVILLGLVNLALGNGGALILPGVLLVTVGCFLIILLISVVRHP